MVFDGALKGHAKHDHPNLKLKTRAMSRRVQRRSSGLRVYRIAGHGQVSQRQIDLVDVPSDATRAAEGTARYEFEARMESNGNCVRTEPSSPAARIRS